MQLALTKKKSAVINVDQNLKDQTSLFSVDDDQTSVFYLVDGRNFLMHVDVHFTAFFITPEIYCAILTLIENARKQIELSICMMSNLTQAFHLH